MQLSKRIIAMILVLVMSLSIIPISPYTQAFGETTETQAETTLPSEEVDPTEESKSQEDLVNTDTSEPSQESTTEEATSNESIPDEIPNKNEQEETTYPTEITNPASMENAEDTTTINTLKTIIEGTDISVDVILSDDNKINESSTLNVSATEPTDEQMEQFLEMHQLENILCYYAFTVNATNIEAKDFSSVNVNFGVPFLAALSEDTVYFAEVKKDGTIEKIDNSNVTVTLNDMSYIQNVSVKLEAFENDTTIIFASVDMPNLAYGNKNNSMQMLAYSGTPPIPGVKNGGITFHYDDNSQGDIDRVTVVRSWGAEDSISPATPIYCLNSNRAWGGYDNYTYGSNSSLVWKDGSPNSSWSSLSDSQRNRIVGILVYGCRPYTNYWGANGNDDHGKYGIWQWNTGYADPSDGSMYNDGLNHANPTSWALNKNRNAQAFAATQLLVWEVANGVSRGSYTKYYCSGSNYPSDQNQRGVQGYADLIWSRAVNNPDNVNYNNVNLKLIWSSSSSYQGGIRLYQLESPNGNISVKKAVTGSNQLSGWVMELYGSYSDAANRTNRITTATTNGSGIATFTDLPSGNTYYIREATSQSNASSGWQISTAIVSGSISAGSTVSAGTITNTAPGSLSVTKNISTAGGPSVSRANWKFFLYTTQANANAQTGAIASAYTNSSGVATFSGLTAGQTYYIREGSAGYQDKNSTTGWVIPSTVLSATVSAGSTVSVGSVTNQAPGQIYGKKSVSGNTGKLSGWVFQVATDSNFNNIVSTKTTDSNGNWNTGYVLTPGTYYVREAPYANQTRSDKDSFILDNTVITINVSAGQNASAYKAGTSYTSQNIERGKIQVKKAVMNTDSNAANLSGWLFRVYSDANCTKLVTSITTGNDGLGTSGYLVPGTYYVKEAPMAEQTGRSSDEWTNYGKIWTINVTAGNTVKAYGANDPTALNYYGKTSKPVRLIKISKNNLNPDCYNQIKDNAMYTLAGAQYQIIVDGVVSEVITTDEDGIAVSAKEYEMGTTIIVKEIAAPNGFKLDTSEHTFKITVEVSDFYEITVDEEPAFDPQAERFKKIDPETGAAAQGNASFEGAIFRWDYYDNTNWSGNPVRTWYFKTNNEGSYGYSADFLAIGYNSNALYKSPNNSYQLPLGSVKITEVVSPLGYKELPVMYATITQTASGEQAVWKYTDETLQFLNNSGDLYTGKEPEDTTILGKLSIKKLDADYGENIFDWATFKGCEFTVYNRSTNAVKIGDYAIAQPGEACYVLTIGEDGTASTDFVFPIGKYEVKETKGNEHYLCNTDWSYTFTVDGNNENPEFATECTNTMKPASITVTKGFENAGDYTVNVANWRFDLYATQADAEAETNVLQTAYTDASGVATFNNLKNDITYYVREASAAKQDRRTTTGWTLNDTVLSKAPRILTPTSIGTITNKVPTEINGVKTMVSAKGITGKLSDWVFQIATDRDFNNVVATLKSDANGNWNTGFVLAAGTYYVREAPYELQTRSDKDLFALDNTVIEIVAPAGKNTPARQDGTDYTSQNSEKGQVNVKKDIFGIKADSTTLNNWVFNIYSDEDCTNKVTSITTDGNGNGTSILLAPGKYWIKEAPQNEQKRADIKMWAISEEVFPITILAGDTINAYNEKGFTTTNYYGKYIRLTKVANNGTNPDCYEQIKDNAMYTLAGAQYQIIVNGKVMETITTGADGIVISNQIYTVGTTGIIKELVAPDGYLLDETEYPFSIEANAVEYCDITAKDIPAFDPINQQFKKIEAETVVAQGNTTFEGAIFRWDYYDNTNWTGTPVRTWYFKTNNEGFYGYSSEYLATDYTNDELYKSTTGDYKLPLGSVKITEVECPIGYKKLPVMYATVTQKGMGLEAIHAYTDETMEVLTKVNDMYTGIEPEDEKTLGKVTIQKTDKLHGPIAPTWATFEGCEFTIYNRSNGPVKIGDYAIAQPGEICYVLTIGEDGTASTDFVFPIGEYEIKETKGNEFYQCNTEWSYTFTIDGTDENPEFETECKNILKPATITIEKVDTKKQPLAGSRFLLEWSKDGNDWAPVTKYEVGHEFTFTTADIKAKATLGFTSKFEENDIVIGGCLSENLDEDGCLTVGEDGKIVFEGLCPVVYYRITEVSTVNGYQLLKEPILVEKLTNDNNYEAKYRVVNNEAFAIPNTGSNDFWMLVPCFGIASMIMFFGVYTFVASTPDKKKRKN